MGIKVNQKELEVLCKDLMKTLWNEDFDLPVVVSSRMTRALGMFQYEIDEFDRKTPKRLKIAERLLAGDYKMETIVSVIKHELCHYHMFRNRLPFADGAYQFEAELRRIGAHATRIIQRIGIVHAGICSCCGSVAITGNERKVKNRCDNARYSSRCCRAKITYIGSKYVEDNTQQVASSIPIYIPTLTALGMTAMNEAEPIQDEVAPVISTDATLKIEDIVKAGKKGITRTQVHPAVEKAVDEKNPEKLKLIKQNYPEYYKQVLMYISKKRLSYISEIGLTV